MPEHLERIGGTWRFRLGVPAALRPIVGKREFRVSLKTSNLKEAKQRAHSECLKAEAQLDQAKRTLAIRAGTAPQAELSDAEAWQLAREWLHYREKQDDARQTVEPGDTRERLYIATDPDAIAQTWLATSKFLRERGIDIEFGSPSYLRLSQRIREAQVEAEKRLLARFTSDPVTLNRQFDAVSSTIPLPNTGKVVTLEKLLADYRHHRGQPRSLRTKMRQDVQDRLFKDLLGAQTPVRSITREDCRRVREVLERMPANASKRGIDPTRVLEMDRAKLGKAMSPATSNSYIFTLSSIFQYALDEELIDKNPARGLRLPNDGTHDKDKRLAFSNDDLQRIVNAPIFREQPRGARFWIPILAIFTGCRLSEIVMLQASDVVVKDGVSVILVRSDEATGKSVKTAAGKRIVPLHAELLKFSFLDFVEHIRGRHGPETRLFPEVKSATREHASVFSKWFARFLDVTVGITDARKNFHSFRHTVADCLKSAHVPPDVIDSLLGWESGSMRSRYGSGLRVSTLASAVNQIEYRGLDLSHLQ